jgi:hypothetical protein
MFRPQRKINSSMERLSRALRGGVRRNANDETDERNNVRHKARRQRAFLKSGGAWSGIVAS